MFHIRAEGQKIKNGINFYPLNERNYSIGFIIKFGSFLYQIRWANRNNLIMKNL